MYTVHCTVQYIIWMADFRFQFCCCYLEWDEDTAGVYEEEGGDAVGLPGPHQGDQVGDAQQGDYHHQRLYVDQHHHHVHHSFLWNIGVLTGSGIGYRAAGKPYFCTVLAYKYRTAVGPHPAMSLD